MGWKKVRPVPYLQQPKFKKKPMRYTATVIRERQLEVIAVTDRGAKIQLEKELEKGKRIIAVQYNLL